MTRFEVQLDYHSTNAPTTDTTPSLHHRIHKEINTETGKTDRKREREREAKNKPNDGERGMLLLKRQEI